MPEFEEGFVRIKARHDTGIPPKKMFAFVPIPQFPLMRLDGVLIHARGGLLWRKFDMYLNVIVNLVWKVHSSLIGLRSDATVSR
jgi:hypothetical protein